MVVAAAHGTQTRNTRNTVTRSATGTGYVRAAKRADHTHGKSGQDRPYHVRVASCDAEAEEDARDQARACRNKKSRPDRIDCRHSHALTPGVRTNGLGILRPHISAVIIHLYPCQVNMA